MEQARELRRETLDVLPGLSSLSGISGLPWLAIRAPILLRGAGGGYCAGGDQVAVAGVIDVDSVLPGKAPKGEVLAQGGAGHSLRSRAGRRSPSGCPRHRDGSGRGSPGFQAVEERREIGGLLSRGADLLSEASPQLTLRIRRVLNRTLFRNGRR